MDNVRIGTVTACDISHKRVRVFFPDAGITSGWLYCLQRTSAISISEADDHAHDASSAMWVPRINATVLCLYLPVQDGDGFVLGEIGGDAG